MADGKHRQTCDERVEELEALCARYRKAIIEVAAYGSGDGLSAYCPWCGEGEGVPHAADCIVPVALKDD